MGKELNISTGIEEYSLNGKVTINFNPTDADFTDRLYKTFDYLDKQQDEYKKKIDESKNIEEALSFLKSLDADMRKHLTELFGKDIVTPLIGTANVYALADGTPIWFNIMISILDIIEEGMEEQAKASKERIKKYTAKYAVTDHKKKATK